MLVVYHKARPPSVSSTSDLLQSLSVTLYYPYLSTVTDELSILAAHWLKGQLISVYYLNKSHDWLSALLVVSVGFSFCRAFLGFCVFV